MTQMINNNNIARSGNSNIPQMRNNNNNNSYGLVHNSNNHGFSQDGNNCNIRRVDRNLQFVDGSRMIPEKWNDGSVHIIEDPSEPFIHGMMQQPTVASQPTMYDRQLQSHGLWNPPFQQSGILHMLFRAPVSLTCIMLVADNCTKAIQDLTMVML